jgi:hypothetical protein
MVDEAMDLQMVQHEPM